jgi:[ribosomal protein S5]-alanine N-acetyltransferase
MPRPPERFETARLAARPIAATDAPAVFAAYANDPVVTRFLVWRAYREVGPLEEFLKTREELWRTGNGHFTWLLSLRESGEVAGSIGMDVRSHHTVFGYVLARKLWGRGLMAEALRYLVDWSLAQPEIHRAWAFCDTENPSSARVMEKAGMQREGVLRRWHVCPTIGPEPRDCIVCARVK